MCEKFEIFKIFTLERGKNCVKSKPNFSTRGLLFIERNCINIGDYAGHQLALV